MVYMPMEASLMCYPLHFLKGIERLPLIRSITLYYQKLQRRNYLATVLPWEKPSKQTIVSHLLLRG